MQIPCYLKTACSKYSLHLNYICHYGVRQNTKNTYYYFTYTQYHNSRYYSSIMNISIMIHDVDLDLHLHSSTAITVNYKPVIYKKKLYKLSIIIILVLNGRGWLARV